MATNVPPEDQDGSGDDSDNFSGSGAGSLSDFTLSRHTSPTWSTLGLLSASPTAPEPTGLDTTASIPPTAERPVLVAEAEPGLMAPEKEASHAPGQPTQHPTTAQESGVRSTTASVTSHPHKGTMPVPQETSAPSAPSQLDPQVHHGGEGGPAVTEKVVEDGAANQFPGVEGSGEQDFTFETTGENTAEAAVELGERERGRASMGREAPGASQSLLDRKEVLGGVIAGGLVGLIFAVCLVGFMLYRMKKKDEGSYSLEEPKQANGGAYQKPSKQEEFYA